MKKAFILTALAFCHQAAAQTSDNTVPFPSTLQIQDAEAQTAAKAVYCGIRTEDFFQQVSVMNRAVAYKIAERVWDGDGTGATNANELTTQMIGEIDDDIRSMPVPTEEDCLALKESGALATIDMMLKQFQTNGLGPTN